MEALNVLRIEKGFITHAEIHGRVTAFDIGLDKMVSAKNDCIGKAARSGRACRAPSATTRRLKGRGADMLVAGAHLFTRGTEVRRETDQGYVTSVADGPPTLEASIGLAFLKNGRARHGEVVRLVDHLRGIDLMVEVCEPVFHDKEG